MNVTVTRETEQDWHGVVRRVFVIAGPAMPGGSKPYRAVLRECECWEQDRPACPCNVAKPPASHRSKFCHGMHQERAEAFGREVAKTYGKPLRPASRTSGHRVAPWPRDWSDEERDIEHYRAA